jgi:GNAT superfamily N-acetyltransferase
MKTGVYPSPSLDIRALDAGTLADFLAFFDTDAFADNPRWAFCYCQFLYVDHNQVDWKSRSLDENRTSACDRVNAQQMQGLLAYVDERVVAWCNAAPRPLMHAFDDEPDPIAGQIGMIGCFVVEQSQRRRGHARALLRAACDGFRAQGLSHAQALARRDAASEAENHFGHLSMYLAEGFAIHREEADGTLILRKSLSV